MAYRAGIGLPPAHCVAAGSDHGEARLKLNAAFDRPAVLVKAATPAAGLSRTDHRHREKLMTGAKVVKVEEGHPRAPHLRAAHSFEEGRV